MLVVLVASFLFLSLVWVPFGVSVLVGGVGVVWLAGWWVPGVGFGCFWFSCACSVRPFGGGWGCVGVVG